MAESFNEGGGRRELLVSLARRLAEGRLPSEEVRELLPRLEAAEPAEVVEAVDELVLGGMELERMKGAVSRLLNLLHRSLSARAWEPADPLFRLLSAENRAALGLLGRARPPLALLLSGAEARPAAEAADREAARAELAALIEALGGQELHYLRKENVLFPYFEARHPRYRCISLMWSLHDDVRRSLRDLSLILGGGELDLAALSSATGRLFFNLHTLVFREESLLFPVLAPLLSDFELGRLYREARALGPGLLGSEELSALDAEAEAWARTAGGSAAESRGAPGGAERPSMKPAEGEAGSEIGLGEGSLPPLVLDLILRSLPLDLSFVDARDRVRYYSNGEERIFPRSPAIIGREVRNCHPAASVARVMALLEAFRRGEADREAFWIERRGRFIHIEYRALRGPGGEYLGTLEISQDLTEKRALSGEKRLASF